MLLNHNLIKGEKENTVGSIIVSVLPLTYERGKDLFKWSNAKPLHVLILNKHSFFNSFQFQFHSFTFISSSTIFQFHFSFPSSPLTSNINKHKASLSFSSWWVSILHCDPSSGYLPNLRHLRSCGQSLHL